MLTLQFINENPEHVIERLAVKNFDAREPIMKVVELDKQRRAAQKERDDNASQLNKMAAQIGALMKQGKREEAEQAKAAVAALKATNKEIDDRMSAAANDIMPSATAAMPAGVALKKRGCRKCRFQQYAAVLYLLMKFKEISPKQ